jgi:uncharacterized membrane protein YdjX (TVP38/TMEM64 family)
LVSAPDWTTVTRAEDSAESKTNLLGRRRFTNVSNNHLISDPPTRRRWFLGFAGLLAVLAAARLLPLQAWLRAALDWAGQLGPWGPVLFIALYVVATVLFLPGSVLTLGAGAVFGVVWGSVYVSVASTLGATCAFLVGRHFARDAILRQTAGNERFAALDRAVAAEGWKIVGLTRLSPVFPFALLNYTFGLTQVKLGHFVLASWLGMMPGTVLYVYLGSLAQAAAGERTRTTGEWTLYVVGLLATIAVTVMLTRVARRALAPRIN